MNGVETYSLSELTALIDKPFGYFDLKTLCSRLAHPKVLPDALRLNGSTLALKTFALENLEAKGLLRGVRPS